MHYTVVLISLAALAVVRGQFIPEPPGTTECFQTTSEPGRGPYDEPLCYGKLLAPFCSPGSDGNPYCHPCHPYRTSDWECDCPANYYCRPYLGRPDNVYADGYCVPFDEATKTCTSTLDCDVYQVGFQTLTTLRLGRFSCVNGYCRPCNTTYWGNATKTCTAWDHTTQTGSSRPGETRSCNAMGYLVGGGALATTQPPPSTTPPPSATATAASTTTASATNAAGGTTTTSDGVSVSVALIVVLSVSLACISM